MKTRLMFASTGLMFAATSQSFASFDPDAALWVGGITFVVVCLVILAAALIPFIAMTVAGTLAGGVAIVGIAFLGAVAAGCTAGYIKGKLIDDPANLAKTLDTIAKLSNQMQIHFEPSDGNSKQAADFKCVLVVYEEEGIKSKSPKCNQRKIKIERATAQDFFQQVRQEMENWLTQPVLADSEGRPRWLKIYMEPFPGEGTFQKLKDMVNDDLNKIRKCDLTRSEGPWKTLKPN